MSPPCVRIANSFLDLVAGVGIEADIAEVMSLVSYLCSIPAKLVAEPGIEPRQRVPKTRVRP